VTEDRAAAAEPRPRRTLAASDRDFTVHVGVRGGSRRRGGGREARTPAGRGASRPRKARDCNEPAAASAKEDRVRGSHRSVSAGSAKARRSRAIDSPP
jgi:hypothetical protein